MIENEHVEAAQHYHATYGAAGEREIQKNLGDVLRGGDAEIINHWQSVLRAFRALTGS